MRSKLTFFEFYNLRLKQIEAEFEEKENILENDCY